MILPQTNREPSLERVYHREHLRHQWQFITKFQLFLQCYTFCCNIGNVTSLQIQLECWLKETLVLTAASIFCYCSISAPYPIKTSRVTALHRLEKGKACHCNIQQLHKVEERHQEGQTVSSCRWELCTLTIETLLSCQDQYAFPSSLLIHTRTQKSMTSN